MLRPKAEKDLYAGLFYLLLGAGFLWFGQNYRFGTAAEMGPGYFPLVLAGVLALIGLVAVARSFVSAPNVISRIHFRPLVLIILACVGFGLLLTGGGLVVALCFAAVVSAAASKDSIYDLKALFVLIALVAFCVIVFIKGLGVPMPIFGAWFDGVVPTSWQR